VLELIKDYDIEVHYHPRKANIMANALRWKNYTNELRATLVSDELCAGLEHLNLGIVTNTMEVEVTPTLEKDIQKVS
jgi:hypothetical protein